MPTHFRRDELEQLSRLGRTMEGPELISAYNSWARSHGFIQRRARSLLPALERVRERRAGSQWHQEEVNALLSLVGNQPLRYVVQAHHRWADKHGHPRRSAAAIRFQLHCRGISAGACGAWILVSLVRKLTGRSASTLNLWVRAGVARRGTGPSDWSLCRRDIVRLARKRPLWFAGISRANLIQLLESDDLVDRILELCPPGNPGRGRGRAVMVVQLGRKFPSCAAAAKACHLERHSVAAALREGRPAGGYTFRAVAG